MITTEKYNIKRLSIKGDIDNMVSLIKQLNKDISDKYIKDSLKYMFQYKNYQCFGFYNEDKLVGLSSGWTTIKIYSGKQLEVDNVIIDNKYQSKGYGKIFFKIIEHWAKQHGYKTIELNTYIHNDRSHKFYFNQGYTIKGYHFQKIINN